MMGQATHNVIGTYDQNQHFAELRQKVGTFILKLVLRRGSDGIYKAFVKKIGKHCQPSIGQTYYSKKYIIYWHCVLFLG